MRRRQANEESGKALRDCGWGWIGRVFLVCVALEAPVLVEELKILLKPDVVGVVKRLRWTHIAHCFTLSTLMLTCWRSDLVAHPYRLVAVVGRVGGRRHRVITKSITNYITIILCFAPPRHPSLVTCHIHILHSIHRIRVVYIASLLLLVLLLLRWWGTSDAGTKMGTVAEDEFV